MREFFWRLLIPNQAFPAGVKKTEWDKGVWRLVLSFLHVPLSLACDVIPESVGRRLFVCPLLLLYFYWEYCTMVSF